MSLRALRGLRARLLAAMLLVSAVTLGVAAIALLSPLEARLRADGTHTARVAMTASLPELTEIEVKRPSGQLNQAELLADSTHLAHRAGSDSQVTVLGEKLKFVFAPRINDANIPDFFKEARTALATGNQVDHASTGTLVIAQRIKLGAGLGPRYAHHYVVVLVKHLQFVALAARVVQTAFVVAAAAGLLTALLLGFGLATTMLRRLARLRSAVRRMEGPAGVQAPLPRVGGRDEIAELARAFAAMQRRLRDQEDARRNFVATASHELRTPLASLQAMLELIEEDLAEDGLDLKDARLRTGHAREQARRLSKLASDLLDLSRIDADVQLRSEPLELGELTRAVAAELAAIAAEREVELDLQAPAQPCWASGDPGSVARIVRILLDNALRVAPPGSTVRIASGAGAAGTARVLVRDQGPGVPEGDRERIFERFTRGQAGARRPGFGLGLAIGRELADRMGGSLRLAQPGGSRPGEGACFELTLPASTATAAALEPAQEGQPA